MYTVFPRHDRREGARGYHVLPCDRDQLFLMPPALQEWLPEGALAWVILDAVAQMDLTKIERTYRADGWGQAAYEPAMMVAVLLYAYCLGERSGRQIERLCERDVAFRVLAANQRPDHTTIVRFRQTHETALATLFTPVLTLCAAAGLVKVGVVALDGTTIKADAALAANRTAATIAAEVTRMLTEAQATDAAEDRLYGPEQRGDARPEALRDRRSRLARLQACQERLTQEAATATVQQQAKIKARQAAAAATGRKKRGRKPKAAAAAADATAKANVTDPESRIMKTQGGYVQGYKAQAIVTEADPDGPALLIATSKDWKQRQALREQPPPRGRCPKGLTARDRMERTLLTTRGRRLYKKRGQTVEPVFGQIKSTRGCDRFMRRGKAACDSEWKVLCATHNLLKLWRSGKAAWAGQRRGSGQRRLGRGSGKKIGDDPREGHAPSQARQRDAQMGTP